MRVQSRLRIKRRCFHAAGNPDQRAVPCAGCHMRACVRVQTMTDMRMHVMLLGHRYPV